MVIERFFEDFAGHRWSLPPELGQVGINFKTAELHLHGKARECIQRRLREYESQSIYDGPEA
jgi:hypothetical protein